MIAFYFSDCLPPFAKELTQPILASGLSWTTTSFLRFVLPLPWFGVLSYFLPLAAFLLQPKKNVGFGSFTSNHCKDNLNKAINRIVWAIYWVQLSEGVTAWHGELFDESSGTQRTLKNVIHGKINTPFEGTCIIALNFQNKIGTFFSFYFDTTCSLLQGIEFLNNQQVCVSCQIRFPSTTTRFAP